MRFLTGNAEYLLEVKGDGAWTVKVERMGKESPPFSARGDYVTGIFELNSTVALISNNGRSNFVVWLHCDDGSDLIANEIGPVSGSMVLRNSGPCFFEVQSDGHWSIGLS